MPLNINLVSGPILEPITLAQAKAQCRVDASFTDDDALFAIYISAARQLAEKITRRAFFNQIWQRALDNFPLAASFDYTPSPSDKWNWPVYGGMWNRLTIDLPLGRAQRVTAITYQDVNGDTVTLDSTQFYADLTSEPCRITPANGFVWPWQGTYLPGSVQIVYEAASFILPVVETFTVPASPGPYTYTLLNANPTGVQSVTAVVGGVVTSVTGWAFASGVLTLPASQAGASLTVTYSTANCPFDVIVALLMLVEHFYRNPGATTDLKLDTVPLGVQSLLSDYVVEWTDYRPC